MKKITIISFDSINNPFYGGGGAIVIHEIAKRLAKQYALTIVTSSYPGSQSEMIDGVLYKRIPGLSFSPRISQLLFQFILPFYAPGIISQSDIILESYTSPFSTACFQAVTNKPVIGLIQLLAGKEIGKKYHLPLQFLEALKIRSYKYCIVLNENIQNKVKQINSHVTVTIIPNGIEDLHVKKLSHKKSAHILYIGRIDIWQKGLDLLLEAYKQIEAQTKVKLVICGAGSPKDLDSLQELIGSQGLENKVALMGKVEGDMKKKMFSEAICLVLPSRYETQPLTLLEAFSFGVPSICWDIPDLSWISSQECVKVKPFNTHQYALKLLKLIQDPSFSQALSKKAKKFSQRFNWDTSVEKYQQFFEMVTN